MPRRPPDESPPRPRRRPPAVPPRQPRSHRPAEPAPAPGRSAGGLSGLFRGAGSVLGQVSGIDVPARALDRLAASAERAASFLDRLDAEVGIERAIETLDRLDHVGDLLEDSHRALLEIERLMTEIHGRVTPPLVRLPLSRRRAPASTPRPRRG